MADSNSLVHLPDDALGQLIAARNAYDIAADELQFVLYLTTDFDYAAAWTKVYGPVDDPAESAYTCARRLAIRPDIAKAIITELHFHGQVLLINKNVIMSRMWTEATSKFNKGSERIRALEVLARMTGDLDPTGNNAAPIVNIQINNNGQQEAAPPKEAYNPMMGVTLDLRPTEVKKAEKDGGESTP